MISKAKVSRAIDLLRQKGVPDPVDSVKWLAQAANGDADVFEGFIQRRQRREPVQYIVGKWDFHDLSLLVRPPVLIPRPETEELVEFVLQRFPSDVKGKPIEVLDVGTGTGAIALALAKAKPNVRCVAIECDELAVNLATENAKRLSLENRVDIRRVAVEDFMPSQRFDIVVSNPPYIPSKEVRTLQEEVRLFESSRALDGQSNDGGEIPRRILLRSHEFLRPGGQLFMELHHTHSALVVSDWLRSMQGANLQLVESRRDFAGIERFHMFTVAEN